MEPMFQLVDPDIGYIFPLLVYFFFRMERRDEWLKFILLAKRFHFDHVIFFCFRFIFVLFCLNCKFAIVMLWCEMHGIHIDVNRYDTGVYHTVDLSICSIYIMSTVRLYVTLFFSVFFRGIFFFGFISLLLIIFVVIHLRFPVYFVWWFLAF